MKKTNTGRLSRSIDPLGFSLKALGRLFGPGKQRRATRSWRPWLEQLEDRNLLTGPTLTMTALDATAVEPARAGESGNLAKFRMDSTASGMGTSFPVDIAVSGTATSGTDYDLRYAETDNYASSTSFSS